VRSTFTIDDELLEKAKDYSGIEGTKDVIHAALKELVQREAARRLANMGGSEPALKAPPRRRLPAA